MKSLITALTLSLGLVAATAAQAALVDRGGGLIYDTDLNITWLADANYAQTSGFDADGRMDWSTAMTWAGNLSYGGYTDWRLPTSNICGGYNCTGSEMGHLFYNELGGVAAQDIATTHNTNYDLFANVQSFGYWSGTEYAPDTSSAWVFNFGNGSQGTISKLGTPYAWAVRGDVAAVPVPSAAWLFGSGLLGLIGVARRKKA